MPVSWTPEVDRILLQTLIETHGISINAQKIVDAWPKEASAKPTTRAITERFVKIRQLTGAAPTRTPKAKLSSAAPPAGRARLAATPKSTPSKKRKIKDDYESDGDDHWTPDESMDETPSKISKTKGASGGAVRRSANMKGKGHVLGDAAGSPANGLVKTEPEENPFENFQEHKARAGQLRAAMTSTAPQLHNSFSSQYSDFHGIPASSSEFDNFDGVNDTFDHLNSFTAANMANQDFNYVEQDMNGMGTNNGNNTLLSASRAVPTPSRERTPRKAGTKAKQNVSQFVQNEKQLDREMGQASSVEDSAASQFEDDDEDAVV